LAVELIKQHPIDLVIVELFLDTRCGLDLVKFIRDEVPGCKTLVLSAQDERVFAERALRCGAAGYLMKRSGLDILIPTIEKILDGQVVVSPQIEQLLLKRITGSQLAVSPLQNLSNRELEVFQLMAQGEQTSDISKHLCISVKTVQTHHAHIKKKLGAANLHDLRRLALTWRDPEGLHS